MKNKRKNRVFALVMAAVLMIAMIPATSFAAEITLTDDIVILFTGDVHGQADTNLGYAGLAAYENEMKISNKYVTVVDAGDAVSGTMLASVSKGEYIIEAMNLAGYDFAVPGVHDFDYGVSHFGNTLVSDADFQYLSCNFVESADGDCLLSPYKIVTYGSRKVAFIGISDPQTASRSSVKFGTAFAFRGADRAADLYASVQSAINSAVLEGADYIVAVGHLVSDPLDAYSASAVIQNTAGINAFIQGNSHIASTGTKVKDAGGNTVLLTCAGSGLKNIGVLTIREDNTLEAKLINNYSLKDITVQDGIEKLKASYNADLATAFAATSSRLEATTASGTRTIDKQETNLGDLVADAYRTVTGADVALVESKEIRSSLAVGDISYKDVSKVLPEGRAVSVAQVTGAEIMDALEMSARLYPNSNGGFLQVSGVTYDIQETVIPSVSLDAFGKFNGVSGEYRVTNVMVGGKALDLFETYTVAGTEELLSGSTGYTMFGSGTIIQPGAATDSQAVISYISNTLNGTVGSLYAKSQGRVDSIRLARQSEIVSEVEERVSDKLKDYETRIAELEKQLKQKNDALAVKSVAITTSSVFGKSSGKRYIKVTWKVSDDVDGMKYQVWKSSKKSSGYSKMITTSKLYYKNTSGLTKGKTYYYKVRGYKSIGGKYYYTNWSNVVYRTVSK